MGISSIFENKCPTISLSLLIDALAATLLLQVRFNLVHFFCLKILDTYRGLHELGEKRLQKEYFKNNDSLLQFRLCVDIYSMQTLGTAKIVLLVWEVKTNFILFLKLKIPYF